MGRHEFLFRLRDGLPQLSQEQRDSICAFFAEFICDSMEDGMSEEAAVRRLGSVDAIVRRIAAEISVPSIDT